MIQRSYLAKIFGFEASRKKGLTLFLNELPMPETFVSKDPRGNAEIKHKSGKARSDNNAIGVVGYKFIDSLLAGKVVIGYTTNGYYAAEVIVDNGTAIAAIAPDGSVKSSIRRAGSESFNKISFKDGKYEAQAVIAVLAAKVVDIQKERGSKELVQTINNIIQKREFMDIVKFSSIIYYECSDEDFVSLGSNFAAGDLPVLNPSLENIGGLSEKYFGSLEPSILNGEAATASTENTVSELVNLNKKYGVKEQDKSVFEALAKVFALPNKGTQEYFAFVDTLKDLSFAKRHKGIASSNRAVHFVGASGTGKSTIARAIAQTAGYDDVYVENGATVRIHHTDWFAKIMPVIDVSDDLLPIPTNEDVQTYDVPSFEDIIYAPEVAYEMLYGEECNSQDGPDIVSICKDVSDRLARQKRNNSDAEFMLVLSQLGQALLFGGVCEVQEINMLKDVNETNGLYAALQEGKVELPDGRVFDAHPDSFTIFTMNKTRGVVRPLPAAFISRSSRVFDFKDATPEVMAQQAMTAIPGLDYSQVLEMAKFMDACREYADSTETLNVRALNAWILASLDDSTIYDAAKSTIINKASLDPIKHGAMIGMLEESPFMDTGLGKLIITDESL